MPEDNVIDFATEKIRRGDHMVRGTAADGLIRAIAVTARDTVETAHQNHSASSVATAALGRLMMGALMMSTTMKSEDELLTLQIAGDGPLGGITVTANSKGQVKGFVNHPNVWLPPNGRGKLDVGGAVGSGSLTVIRDMPGAEPYTSQVGLVSGEIGDDLAGYFVLSDQIPTSVGVGVLVNSDTTVRQAGGFLIQLMPGYDDELIDRLEAALTGVSSVTDMLERGMGPSEILESLLGDFGYQELEVSPVEFHCGCNHERAKRAALALGEDELRDMIAKDETAEIYCHFCGKRHYLTPDELRDLLSDKD
jgi:molecular chaperone Hsp33